MSQLGVVEVLVVLVEQVDWVDHHLPLFTYNITYLKCE